VTDGSNPSLLGQFHFQSLPAAVAKLSDAQIAKISS
jgi:phosphate transport system substrate-binding protein